MDTKCSTDITGAEAFLSRLAARGIRYVIANAGTDFAPIIEALSDTRHCHDYPEFVTAPHENLAMGMANGYYRATGKPAAVMLHVTVGTANALCQLINMDRDNVPVLLCAGRTPATESGHIASRDVYIHWGQESFDQGGMLREYVKWDYELRAGQPVGALVDRALDIAMTEPRGPVYLCLPREVLSETATPMRRDDLHDLGVKPPFPQADLIDEVAHLILVASNPLIITSSVGRSVDGVQALAKFAAAYAVPVIQINATDLNLTSHHEMNLGYSSDPGAHLQKADLVLVIDSIVPWVPRTSKPKAGTKIVNFGVDPLFGRVPFREFETDMMIAGNSAASLRMLHNAMERAGAVANEQTERRASVARTREELAAARVKLIQQSQHETPIHPAWLAHCLNEAKSEDAIIVNELGTSPARLDLGSKNSYIGISPAGGLGSGLGTALGAKLGAPHRDVIAIVGDGSYMFGNPLPYHFVQRANKLATLTIVANNHQWLAVKQSTLAVYPNGAAAKTNKMPLQELDPSPDFEKVAESCGGYGESVRDPSALLAAIRRGLDKTRQGIPALLNVHTRAVR